MWHVLSQLIPCGGNLTHLTPTWRLWYLFRDCWFGFAWSLAVLRPILGLLKSWAPQYSSISAYQLVYPAWLSLSFKSHICWAPFPEWQDLCSVNRIVPSNEPSAKNRYSNRSTIVLVLIVSSSHCIPSVSPISTHTQPNPIPQWNRRTCSCASWSPTQRTPATRSASWRSPTATRRRSPWSCASTPTRRGNLWSFRRWDAG